MKIKLNIKVIPNAKKNEIVDCEGLTVIKINAPAVDGKANQTLIKFLSKCYNVRKSNVKILMGEKSRYKLIEIKNVKIEPRSSVS